MAAAMADQSDLDWIVPTAWLNLQQDNQYVSGCNTCKRRKVRCDGLLPHCGNCSKAGIRCSGYGVRIQWPSSLAKQHTRKSSKTSTTNPKSNQAKASCLVNRLSSPFSTLGLPEGQNFLVQHYLKNLSRIAIAIDYDENGYRSLLHSGINDPCLLYSILAVASSHYSKWQKTKDRESRQYLKKALSSLQSRLKDPTLVYQESTLVAMLSLMSYEIFNGAAGWVPHYQGILGWLSARGNCSDLDSFIKTWISMIDTQKALNLGGSTTAEVQRWLESGNSWTSNCNTIDPFFGCSVRLPKLMAAAAKLFDVTRMPRGSGPSSLDEINIRAEELQQQVRDTKIECASEPSLAMSCHGKKLELCAIEDLNQREYFRRMVAAAEMFRHAVHIYIYRITHEPEEVPTAEIQESIDQMFELLATAPDALGPGSNLGWCLTVLGAELDSPDQREYITCRLQGIQTLGMNNPVSGKKVLERVWTQRDLHQQGFCRIQRWQDIMRDMGEGQILV